MYMGVCLCVYMCVYVCMYTCGGACICAVSSTTENFPNKLFVCVCICALASCLNV